MNIRFTSSLTPDDENLIAPAVVKALASILDLLPIAYMIRIDTSDSRIYERRGPLANFSAGQEATQSRPDGASEVEY